MHFRHLHAASLCFPGVDHERFVYHYGGRDFPFTDACGSVVGEIVAFW